MAHIMSHICFENSRKSLETKFVQCEEVEMIYPNKRALHFLVLGFWCFFSPLKTYSLATSFSPRQVAKHQNI